MKSVEKQYKIAIVEDEIMIRENILEYLSLAGYVCEAYADGKEAFSKITKFNPDLIISDIMMPKMDGYQLFEELKKSDSTAFIPFIFLTAKADLNDVRIGMQIGADDYLIKPFKAKDLLASISIRCKTSEERNKYNKLKVRKKIDEIAKLTSHEYQTPLNGIIGLSEILETSENLTNEEIIEISKSIKKSALRLKHTYRSVGLYFELITQKKYGLVNSIKKSEINLNTNIAELLPKIIINEERKADLVTEIDKTAVTVSVNQNDLKIIILELLGNAFNHSKAGTLIKLILNGFSLIIENETLEENCSSKLRSEFTDSKDNIYERQGLGLGIFIAKNLCLRNDIQFTQTIPQKFKIRTELVFKPS